MFCPSVWDDVIVISDTAVYDGFSVKGFADVTAADYSLPSLCCVRKRRSPYCKPDFVKVLCITEAWSVTTTYPCVFV